MTPTIKKIIILGLILAAVFAFTIMRNAPRTEKIPSVPGDDADALVSGIRSGGPPKDGIPAIDRPRYEDAAKADDWLRPDDVVFGVDYEGETIAFPQRILVWHEIANVTLGGKDVSITYCPLTGTAIGYFSPATDGGDPTFGVSGKLVNSNLIMYDRATDSYWPQIWGQAITGPRKGSSLEELPVIWTTWERWKRAHPATKVLSRNTGFFRNYGEKGDPYGSYLTRSGYYVNDAILFAPLYESAALPPKTVVIGIRDEEGNAAAVVKDALRKKKEVTLQIGDRTIAVRYDGSLDSAAAADSASGEVLNSFDAMWFAWYAFYPDTQLVAE